MNLQKGMMAAAAVICLFVAVALAEVPRQINYQGTLTDSIGNPVSGIQQMVFTIYPSESSPTPLWSEVQHVDIMDGLFHVQLGSLTPLPASIFSGNELWLGVQIAPDLTELLPRQPLVTVPYSFKTTKADTANYSLSSAPDNDWTISGNNIYRLTGNVGIGTASPAFKLDVTGNVNADSLYKIRGNTVLSIRGFRNILVGRGAGANNTGNGVTLVGDSTGPNNQGADNIFLGTYAGYSNSTGNSGTFVGSWSGWSNQGGANNTFIGNVAGLNNINGANNTYVGSGTGQSTSSGSCNTFLGVASGMNNNGDHNVFLGYQAGYYETGSNKLYIANGANNSDVLIYGDFATKHVGIGTTNPSDGTLEVVGGSSTGIIASSSSSNAISATSSAGGGFAAGRFVASNPNTYGVYAQSSGYDALYAYCSSSSNAAIRAVTSGGAYAGTFSGNVGIGTLNPSQLLHVYGDLNPKILVQAPSGQAPELDLQRGTTTHALYVNSANNLVFKQTADNVTFTSDGKVGIGTTNPDVPVQIGNGTHTASYLTSVQIDYDDNNQHGIEVRNNAGAVQYSMNYLGDAVMGAVTTGKNLYLTTDNVARAFIQGTSGNVGIGTTNPDVKFQIGNGTHSPSLVNTIMQIDNDNNLQGAVELCNNSGSSGWAITFDGNSTIGSVTGGKNMNLMAGSYIRQTILGTNGYVGIGTTNPSRLLHVYSDTNPRILVEAPAGQSPELNLQRGTVTHALYVNSGNDLVFYQAGDRVAFTDDGKVGIGTISPSHQLTVNATASNYALRLIGPYGTYGYGARFNFGDGDYAYLEEDTDDHVHIHGGSGITISSGTGQYTALTGGSVGIGTTTPAYPLDVAGSCHATSFPTSSDARLKTNIQELQNVLDKLDKIRGVSFDWNSTYQAMGRSSGHREIGVIAQEVEAQFPELVTTWGDEHYRAVDYGRLTAVLIEAMKELKAENQNLKERIDAIEKAQR
jgi:hypothetical protein